MRLIALITLALVHILAISGCAGVPVKTHPIEEDFVKEADGESLIGKSKGIVIEKFGKPDWEFEYRNRGYFLYTSLGEVDLVWDLLFPIIVLPGSLYDADWGYCALFEFSESEKVTSVAHASDHYHQSEDIVEFCIYELFPGHDAEQLEAIYGNEPRD